MLLNIYYLLYLLKIKTLYVLVIDPNGKSSSIYKYVINSSLLPKEYSEKIDDSCVTVN